MFQETFIDGILVGLAIALAIWFYSIGMARGRKIDEYLARRRDEKED